METIPVEMRMMIMEHLSNAELLALSLVNKLLNYEARSFMRDRVNLMAVLKSAYKDIVPFASDLQKMSAVPFSGITVQLCAEQHLREVCQASVPKLGDLDASFNVMLNRLPLKRLQVTLDGYLGVSHDCPALLLVKKILQSSYCDVLEEISLADNRNFLEFIQEVVRNSRFPRLKILKLKSDGDYKKTLKNFIKEMVARAPHLQEVHQEKEMDYLENVLEGSSAVLVSDYNFPPLIYELPKSVTAGVVKLRRMTLHHHAQQNFFRFNVERFIATIPRLLHTSLATLNSMSVDLVLLVPLMSYEMSLKNVTELKIFICEPNFKLIQPRVLQLLKRFDFTQIFPKLHKVNIEHALINPNFQENRINEFIEREISAMKEPRPGRAENIKHLLFRESFIQDTVPFFAEMLPNIERLQLRTLKGRTPPYQLIWEHWPDLQEVEIRKYGSTIAETWNQNLDSVFCGISPEEAAQLREQDDEYLKAVHIVPPMPSITCLKELRALTIYYADTMLGFESDYMQKIVMTDPSMFIFSKVTGFIAFRRYPNLSVKIGTDSREIFKALRNMRPYATVRCTRKR